MRKSLKPAMLGFMVSLYSLFFVNQLHAQCSVVSANGYVVNVSIIPKTIVVSSSNCPWGYNYNVNFDYNISITGPGAAAQYTLQALIYCVNNQINGAYSLPLGGGSGSAVTTTNPSIPHNGTAYGYNAPYVNCTNATVATMQCNSIDLIIQGPGIPYQQIHCNNTISVLPVEFLYLEGEKKENGNLLTWAVESESRNDYFTLETSTDGTNWKEFAKVKGAGNSTEAKTYTFLDTKNGKESTYYKLSQTDFDGTRNELALKFIPQSEVEFRVYPNPSSDSKVHIDFSNTSDDESSVTVKNELGQIVFQSGLEAAERSGKKTYYSTDLDLEQPAGVYLVEVYSGNQVVERSKLVIR
ncbi:T9SS type A sorting domain-containing protein [Fluviicola sp.]|uniref:T9SS type A sorting domain-containing protein n=1 Tax=Fluviicola sp. TaxID=1917219 RepID=UPI0031D080F2